MTMMTWGDYTFEVNSFPYQTLSRATEFPWAKQDRLQNVSAYQATGKASETMSLQGIVLTAYKGGAVQPNVLRTLASQMKPQVMTFGSGENLGWWGLKNVREEQANIMKDGAPRKQTLSLEFVKDGK